MRKEGIYLVIGVVLILAAVLSFEFTGHVISENFQRGDVNKD